MSNDKSGNKKRWFPLESNPDLMNSYVNKLGVGLEKSGYSFCDVYGLDEEMLAFVPQPCIALLLLFPISKKSEEKKEEVEKKIEKDGQKVSNEVYFTKQTIGNACGTVGIIHAIANNKHLLDIQKHSFFDKFLQDSSKMDADERATLLEDSDNIEEAHQESAKEGSSPADAAMNTNLHFVCFVHKDGCIYELDGRKKHPINHGSIQPSNFLTQTASIIKSQYIALDPSNVNFNIISLSKSP